MPEMMIIPAKFWGALSAERFSELCVGDSYLSLDETRTVYRMQDRIPPEPLQPMQVLINKKDLERVIAKWSIGARKRADKAGK